MSEPLLVLESGDLIVMYFAGRGGCAMTIFSSDPKRNLGAAQGAIKQIATRATHVRYRPEQHGEAAHIIVNFAGELTLESRTSYAGAFVAAIKMLS